MRAAVAIPVLRKDFIVTSYQLWEARAAGADLALLIVAALTRTSSRRCSTGPSPSGSPRWSRCTTRRRSSGRSAAGATLIGVNARNLKTLEVDRDTFARLAPRIPDDVVRVAESGVRGPHDVFEYAKQGANVVLVGETLVTGDDPAARSPTWSPPARTRP